MGFHIIPITRCLSKTEGNMSPAVGNTIYDKIHVRAHIFILLYVLYINICYHKYIIGVRHYSINFDTVKLMFQWLRWCGEGDIDSVRANLVLVTQPIDFDTYTKFYPRPFCRLLLNVLINQKYVQIWFSIFI